jgi:serine/threonine-protein kinase
VADLFVSYKSEDRARVKPLVDALQADGLSVWWDAHIEGGAGWRQRIEQELTSARCVLVAWTKRSAGPEGEFVHDEATRAKRRGVYLPVLLDQVELPLGFGEKQALPLTGWKGDRTDVRYQAVLAAARAVVGSVPLPTAVAAGPSLGRRAVIGGGVALAAAGVGGAGWYFLRPGAPEAKAESIAVLPFANLSGDPGQAWFSDGLAEELRSALSRTAGLKVAARTSSEMMRDADVKEAAAKLGVAHVLTGSVRMGDNKIRVAAQLFNGETGMEVWSERYDRAAGDVLAVQEGIAQSVARTLSLALGEEAARLGGTRNFEAYLAYLRGTDVTIDSAEAARTAIAAFDRAIRLDPGFAAAHAGRARALAESNRWTDLAEIAPSLNSAKGSAIRAIELAPALPMAHAALGRVLVFQVDLPAAKVAYRKAVTLPGVGSAELGAAGSFLPLIGEGEAGMALIDRAVALDPLSLQQQRRRITAMTSLRQFDAALSAMDEFDRANPDSPFDPRVRGLTLLWAGKPKAALAAILRAPDDWWRSHAEAQVYAVMGDNAKSNQALAAMLAAIDMAHFQTAEVLALQGRTDEAFAELEQSLKVRDPGLFGLRTSPAFDRLRQDPRYREIERRAGFPAV